METFKQGTPEPAKEIPAAVPPNPPPGEGDPAAAMVQSTVDNKPPGRVGMFVAKKYNTDSNTDISQKKRAVIRVLAFAAVFACILLFFNVINRAIERMLLAEKVIEKQFQIDVIAGQIDHLIKTDDDWEHGREHHIDTILNGIEMLDQSYMTYAAVFDADLQNLSARSPSYEGSPFEPGTFEEFVSNIHNNETGDLVLPFSPPGSDERDMHLHFQWMPSNAALEDRVLAVVAISRYSVNTKISAWMQTVVIVLSIVAFFIAIFVWRKQMTDSLNRTLEKTVQQRTAELAAQTESAQKASLAKSDFLSNMSHEMRTPMNAIIGMTAIAKNAEEVSRKDYCLKKIEDASTHLLSVINDILDMSKIEANKFELSIEKFNFERVLQSVANVIVFRIDEKRQHFKVHIDKNIPLYLIGDDQRIMQVITNLMSNAVKFTPEGGSIWLDARAVEEHDNICTIQIEVTDTGTGISPEQQSRLFSSFVQAESSTTRRFGGTGLGLAISKHIVEMMNGEIWIKSELGKGSTFAFTFQAERVVQPSSALLDLGVSWSNMRVLVVDDELDTREYFTDIMQRFGSHCDVAASGAEACELIDKNGSYHFYFVDWHMQGMDGIELARRINAMGNSNSVVIMISASEWDEIEANAKGAGVCRFLSKPLFPSNIADCINECLGSDSAIRNGSEFNYQGIFKGYHLLLAEDVEVNREIVLALLEPTELMIDAAENGAAAVELFRSNPDRYDMIFMDVQMPETDGYEATRQIRALDSEKARSIPIVAMTANVFREDIEKCISCGMNDHLGKPVHYDKMISKLCSYLLADSLHTGVK